MITLKHADFEAPDFGEFAAPPRIIDSYRDALLALEPLAYWRLSEAAAPRPRTAPGTRITARTCPA